MTLHKIVDGVVVPLTAAEIAARAAEEAQWAAEAPRHEAARIDLECGLSREDRDIAIKVLDAGHPRRKRAETAEARIAALGIRKEAR